MKARILSLVSGLLLVLVAQSAMAQPSAVVQNVTNVPATATSVNVNVTFTPAAGNTNAAQFDINFNKAELSADHASVCPALWTCTQVAAGIRFVSPFSPGGGLAGFSVNVPFDLTSAMSNVTYPLTLAGELYADVNNQPLAANGSSNGSIQILAPVPDADFIPNAGLLDLGSAPQSTTASTTVTIDNVGPSGSLLDATCGITANGTVFSVTDGTVNDLGAADTPHEVTVGCSSPTIQTHNGTMVCTHNGDGTTNNGESPAQTLTYSLTCEMTAGPTPRYNSNPAPGSTLDFGQPVKDTAPVPLTVEINNDNADDGAVDLSSAGCTLTSNPNGAYSITGGSGPFNIPKGDPDHVVSVECDTSIAGDHDGGTLSCPHNGSNTSTPALYTLNCEVLPVPAFVGTPTAMSPPSIAQNNLPYPLGNVEISNDGDPGSSLTGTCSLTNVVGGAIEFTTGSGGAYALAKDATKDVGVQCNSTAQPGDHSATVSCTENDPNFAGPYTFPFSCSIGQPDPAVYASTPDFDPPPTIDITNGTPIPEGNTDPTSVLQVRNDAQAGDANMLLTCGPISDVFGSAISADVNPSGQSVAPGGSVDITFTCDTQTASETPYEATYGCDWESEFVEPLDSPGGEAPQAFTGGLYTVTCEVREGFAEVTPSPADGTPQVAIVQPGGMKSFFFTFNETGGEGTDAELTSCSLEDGSNFEIVFPDPGTGFPAVIPAGGNVVVEVKGTDPGGVDSFGDELTCIYKDTDNPEGQGVTYPLTLNVGGDAYFTVLKDFTDDNPGEVTVDIDCDTGLILDQEKTITEDGIGVTFVVSSFDTGELNCNVTERTVAGYSTDYESSGDSATTDSDDGKDGCYYTAVNGGDNNLCVVTNDPDDVPVVINKEWLYPGSATGTSVSNYFEIVLVCLYGEIDGGFNLGQDDQDSPSGLTPQDCGPQVVTSVEGAQLISLDEFWCKSLSGNGNTTFTEHVKPYNFQTGALCVAVEQVFDDAIEVDNGCMQGMEISVGKGASCTITNTVFFEGIPTLSQYGMALLALLMLGMGFVAVRRIT